jgi:hypothetical protein
MKIASNGGIPKSSVARADVHCFLFRPCAIPPVCLVDATRPRRARRGPEARAPRENSMCSSSSTGEHGEHHRCGPAARAPRENSMYSRSSTGEHHRCGPAARAPRETTRAKDGHR